MSHQSNTATCVLLILDERHRHLMHDSIAGSRCPSAWEDRPGHWRPNTFGDTAEWREHAEALVLAWEGEPSVYGVTRALTAMHGGDRKLDLLWTWVNYTVGAWEHDMPHIRTALERVGRVVMLDDDWSEASTQSGTQSGTQ